jgi:TIGR03009 family protein
LFVVFWMATMAWAQTEPVRVPEASVTAATSGIVAEPDQPVRAEVPVLTPREAAPATQAPQRPFTLTPQEAAQLDRVLKLWEDRNRDVKTFDCEFKRWVYDVVFGPPNQAKFIDTGIIKYAAPDRGMFRAEKTERNGAAEPIEEARAEHWISDGKAIFEFNHTKRQLIEHKLPPELQGKAIANSPLPFLFGAEAEKLKQRYFMRLVTPADVKDQIWLEAYPRYQQDATNFHHAQFIISAQGMAPFALKLVQPNQKDYTVYQFYDVVVNDPLRLFKGDPFRAITPRQWQRIVEEAPSAAPSAQANRVPRESPH